jgi:hypothetical protein
LLALPREARETSKFNGLRRSLGEKCSTALQSYLETTPKPFGLLIVAIAERAREWFGIRDKHWEIARASLEEPSRSQSDLTAISEGANA